MPQYEFKCTNKECKTTLFDKFRSHKEASKPAMCPECGKKARRQFRNAGFRFDFKEGFDPGLGEYVGTAKERDETVARNNLRRVRS